MGTGKNSGEPSKQGPKLVETAEPAVAEMAKTELTEVGDPPMQPHGDQQLASQIVGSMIRRLAIGMIKEEIELFKGLVQDAETSDEKIKIVRELADLKLTATGHVLAGMSMARGGPVHQSALDAAAKLPITNGEEGGDAPSQ